MTENTSTGDVRIAVILGTSRPGNYTAVVGRLVADELGKHADITVDVVDPSALTLHPPGLGDGNADAEKLTAIVKRAAGLVLATPEYHGSFSAVLKLIIENLGYPSVLRGKPVALVGVAAGGIGAIKALEHLRSVCSHVGAIVLPGPVSVANVRGAFDEQGRCIDAQLEERVRNLARGLVNYVRQSVCPPMDTEAMVRGDAS